VARSQVTADLASVLEFDNAGVRMPRHVRRGGDGRRQRLRRMAGETRRDEVWRMRAASFVVEPGECVAIVGGKGSGREILLRMAAGTLIPDEGAVRRSVPVIPVIDIARSLQRRLTVRQNVYLVGGLLGMTPDAVGARIGEIIAFAGVESTLDKYLGGAAALVRQKLAWSIAMHTGARAYAIEQVLVVGDRDFRQRCWTRVDEMKRDGVTFLLASDSPRQFRRFCDRAILLDNGQITAQTSVHDAIFRLRQSRGRNSPEEVEPGDESSPGPTDGAV